MKKLLWLCLLFPLFAHAAGGFATSTSVTCAASGSSTQVVAATASRQSLLVSNTSGLTIRLAALSSGTGNLTSANSIQILAGQVYADSAPSNFIGRVVCMSTTGATAAVEVMETRGQ